MDLRALMQGAQPLAESLRLQPLQGALVQGRFLISEAFYIRRGACGGMDDHKSGGCFQDRCELTERCGKRCGTQIRGVAKLSNWIGACQLCVDHGEAILRRHERFHRLPEC